MDEKEIITKVSGDIPSPSKKKNQGYIDDLSKKEKFQLEELLERQNNILSKKNLISKLPDKGEKVRSFRDKILKELEHRNEVEKAANLFSRLNIASEGKETVTQLEWTGKCDRDSRTVKVIELDSDDEEDPLRILAQPTGTGVHKKKIVHLAPEESLIKPEDLAEIENFKMNSSSAEHINYIINKIEKQKTNKKKESFKPYKTTKSNVHDPMMEKQRKLPKNWEITAATPPLIVHGAAVVLNLNQSLQLQKKHNELLKELQTKQALERLVNQTGLHNIGRVPENLGTYRLQRCASVSSSSSSSDKEHEVYDDEDVDKGGTVVVTVDSIDS